MVDSLPQWVQAELAGLRGWLSLLPGSWPHGGPGKKEKEEGMTVPLSAG